MFARQRASDRNDWRECGPGLRQTGYQIGCAGAILTRQDHPGTSRCARVAIRHMGSGTLVVNTDIVDLRGIVKRVEHLHRRRTDQAKNLFDLFRLKCSYRGLAARHLLHRQILIWSFPQRFASDHPRSEE